MIMPNQFSTGDEVCIRGIVEGYGFNVNQVPRFSYDIRGMYGGKRYWPVPAVDVVPPKNEFEMGKSCIDKEFKFLDVLYRYQNICKKLKNYTAVNVVEILIHEYTHLFNFSLKDIIDLENKYQEETDV